MSRSEYPETVIEVVDDDMLFRASALRAVRRFSGSRPWRGSLDERKEKFRGLNQSLAAAYGIPKADLTFGHIDGSSSGESHYLPMQHRIVLGGKLSVVTYLHEFAHARGMGERRACRWGINLFRKVLPKQYARLVGRGHMLISLLRLSTRPAERKFQ